MTKDQPSPPIIVAYWLIAMAIIVALMVTVGGATRLTDSGLSITEWDLVKGSVPPLGAEAWAEAFLEYQQIPEYELVNKGMTLAQFKEIFWWEWSHRQLGRFIGMAFLLPLIWFSVSGKVRGGLRWRLWGLFFLIGLQGALGWYMVASGLSERVDVSQYRLALHLGTAVILFGLMVWQIFALLWPSGRAFVGAGLGRLSLAVLAMTFVQIILGAFVAGLRAGKTFNTWPLMDGQFFPAGYFASPPTALDAFEQIAAVQFNHRLGAYILFALASAFLLAAWRKGAAQRRLCLAVFAAVFIQALLGVWTLVAAVPLWLGLAHQFSALMVLTVMIWVAYGFNGKTNSGGYSDGGGAR